MKFPLAILLLFCTLQTSFAQEDVFAVCAQEKEDQQRLACYDEFAKLAAASAESEEVVSMTREAAKIGTSQTIETQETPANVVNGRELFRMASDDPNFFGISWDPGQSNRGVDRHIEFDISLKYPILEFTDNFRFLGIYNGAYDFHAFESAGPYDSKPVLSTTQNPGGAFEFDSANGREKLRLGVFHHSNGQTLDYSDDPEELANSIAEIQRLEELYNEAPALERISRSSWYTQFRYQRMSNAAGVIKDNWWQYQLEIRPWYFWNEDRVFWTPHPKDETQIENFDGIRAVAEGMIQFNEIPVLGDIFPSLPGRGLARLELQTGLWSPLENVGGKISLGINFNSLLVSGYYYSGFAKDISSYHKRTQHMGIGFEFR